MHQVRTHSTSSRLRRPVQMRTMQTTQATRDTVDTKPVRGPGVPEEREPTPVGHAHWGSPPKQLPRAEVIRDATRHDLTATFGSSPPPRLLSGVVRRAAYRIPDYRVGRWLFLLIADRIDAVESRFV